MPQQAFDFTVVLAGVSEMTDALADALYEAGCDDALIGQSEGVVFVDFHREGPSYEEAVKSALADVKKAGFDGKPGTGETATVEN